MSLWVVSQVTFHRCLKSHKSFALMRRRRNIAGTWNGRRKHAGIATPLCRPEVLGQAFGYVALDVYFCLGKFCTRAGHRFKKDVWCKVLFKVYEYICSKISVAAKLLIGVIINNNNNNNNNNKNNNNNNNRREIYMASSLSCSAALVAFSPRHSLGDDKLRIMQYTLPPLLSTSNLR